jgi:23S rRNA (uracil1939-C5)-methyltransferase
MHEIVKRSEMKKGDIIEGVIEEVSFPNRGILRNDWGEIQVKNAIPGQKVRVRVGKKRAKKAEATLLEVVEPSPDELPSPCPQFGKCGGCTYLTLPYDKELALKQVQVMRLLQAGLDEGRRRLAAQSATRDAEDEQTLSSEPGGLGHLDEPWMHVTRWFEGIHASPRIFGFRNKMEFTFGDEVKDGPLTLGMHRRGSYHDICDAGECVIVDSDYRQIVNETRTFFADRSVPFYHRYQQEGYLRHLLVRKASHTGEILIDLVTTSQTGVLSGMEEETLLRDYVSCIQDLHLEGELTGILHTKCDSIADVVSDEGTEILYGRGYFEESLLGLKFVVTPFSFFQTNSYSAEILYTIARQYIAEAVKPEQRGTVPNEAGRPVIYDLYCGTGTISQLVAPVARKVIGVEIVPEAVEAARENAIRNHVGNCEFITGDVLKVLDAIEEKPDLIILDPPRDGVHPKALPKILDYGVQYILYISCKPTSLARDLPSFIEAGYRPIAGMSVDQFVWSANVETIVLLEKENFCRHLKAAKHSISGVLQRF